MPAASSRKAIPAESPPRLLANEVVRREHGAQARERRLLEQRVKRGGDRRVGLPQFVVSPAQLLILSQTRQESGLAAFVELVVDQGDKFRVIVSHCFTKERSYFSFASAARAVASRLMTVPIGTARVAAASA